jgi:hypothetical protein
MTSISSLRSSPIRGRSAPHAGQPFLPQEGRGRSPRALQVLWRTAAAAPRTLDSAGGGPFGSLLGLRAVDPLVFCLCFVEELSLGDILLFDLLAPPSID